MRTRNPSLNRAARQSVGSVSPRAAGSRGLILRDAATVASPVRDVTFVGATLTDNDDGTAVLTFDAALDLSTIIASQTFLTTTDGEGHRVATNLASGAAVTIDCSLANIFDISLTANCTLTISNAPSAGFGGHITVILRQGGSGSYTVTWPASVVWQNPTTGLTGGSAPTLFTAVGAQDDIDLSTLDGGATWGGSHGSAGGSFATPAIVLGTAAAAGSVGTTIRSDATIIAFDATVPASVGTASATGSAAVAARRDHVHDGSSIVTATDHARVAGEIHLSDGASTTFTLDEHFMPGSVEAWNVTTLAWLTVTEAVPDQATISAAGTTGDKLIFNYDAIAA